MYPRLNHLLYLYFELVLYSMLLYKVVQADLMVYNPQ